MEIEKKPTKAWYLFPFILPFIGGIIMYFACRHNDKKMARKGLILGFVWPFIFLLLWILASVALNNVLNSDDGFNDGTFTINESQQQGDMIVTIQEIAILPNYAKIFLTVENVGRNEAHLYTGESYVMQDRKDFQDIPKPLGATGEPLDGYNIPSGIIREGVLYMEPWDYEQPFTIVLKGFQWLEGGFMGLGESGDFTFAFDIEPHQKCGQGTVFDEETNSCIVK